MTLFSPTLLMIAFGCLLIGVCLRRRRAFVEVNPRYRELLQRHGLVDPGRIFDVETVIVSGHPGRNVARLTLADDRRMVILYLKRENRVSWGVRLANAWAGFGFVALALREARVLRSLPHAGIDGPEWVAAGADRRGRAFLLVREVPNAVELREMLSGAGAPSVGRVLARHLGRTLAKVHDAGFDHPDLYAKHVLVDPDSFAIAFLDWQRTRRRSALSLATRARDLAALHATIPGELATWRERLTCLRSYTELAGHSEMETRALARAILKQSARLLARRHIREKRQPQTLGQQWIPLAGGEVCVTPAFQRLFPLRPSWLSLDLLPTSGNTVVRRSVPLGEGRSGELVLRRVHSYFGSLWQRLRRRVPVSPEQRQAARLLRLERYGVRVPRLLALGCRRGRLGCVESLLLTEPFAGAESFEEWITHEWDDDVRHRVLSEVGALVRRLHEACCHLPDLHFPLALRHTADGALEPVLTGADGLLVTRAPSPSLVARNLAALTEELRDLGATATDLRWLLEGYTDAGVPIPHSTAVVATSAPAEMAATRVQAEGAASAHGTVVASLPKATTMPATMVVRHAAPKSAAVSFWTRLFRGGRRLSARADWVELAGEDWAERIMDVEISDRFHAKQGRSTCRWILQAENEDGGEKRLAVYLKRHYRLSRWHGLLATLWPNGNWSPAFSEFAHLEWARTQGVPVPAVVAAAEFIGPWGRFQSVLAVEELAGMLPLHEAIPLAATRLDAGTFRRWKRGLIAEMARITRLLHDRRYFHKDLYLCHFYIARDDTARVPEWRGRVFLIDLHRLTHHAWTWRLWQTKDLAQLLYSTDVPGVDARDRLLFWREYLRPDRPGSGSWLRRYVLFKWRRYRRHNARRKATAAPDLG